MSLHAIADHMASKGRGPDSVLIHMSPNEVQGLQALAMSHGGSLTINPETGLPEAGFLDKLLPTILGAGLSMIPGVGPMLAAGIVGGIQAVRTGDIGKGLAAGLGAYGGAGLAQGLSTAGAASLGAESAAAGLTMTPELTGELMNAGAGESAAAANNALQQQVAGKMAAATPYEKISSGLDAFKNNPMGMTKSLGMPALMAAAPIMADMMVPTTTKAPDAQSPGGIREKIWDGRQFIDVGNTDASVYNTSGRSFSDLYRGYQGGGIVALAGGGVSATDYFLANPDVAKAYNEDIGGYAKGLTAQQFADQHYANFGQAEKRFVNPGLQVDPNQTAAARQYLKQNTDVADYLSSQAGKDYLAANPQFDASDVAYTHFKRYGEDEGRNWGAPTGVVPGDKKLDTATTYDNGAFGNYGSGNQTGVDYKGETVSIATPGDIITNPDNSRTATPNIPGRPYGGFTGIDALKSAYTAGGGSLGYTSPVPTSLEDFNKKYVTDRMSGDSLAAYEYLSGKKGAAYPTKSGVGQIARPYDEAVLGYPTRTNLPYIYNKATGKMDVNPDYVSPRRDDKGNVTYSMSLNDIRSSLKETPLSGQALYDWAMSNNLSAQQIADATERSLSSVYADFRAGSKAAAKKKEDDKAAGIFTDQSSTGGSDSGGGGGGTGGNTISGFNPAAPDPSIAESFGLGPTSTDGNTGSTTGTEGGSVASARGGLLPRGYAMGGGLGSLGSYSDGGRLLRGPGDGVSDSIPATIGRKQQPARLADGEFVIPARIVSELGNGSTDAGAKKLYAMMDRVQRARGKTTGKNKVAANSRADKYLPA